MRVFVTGGWLLFLIALPLCGSVLYRDGPIPQEYNYLAPDGSEIRLVSKIEGAELAHCTLPAGAVTQAVMHQTVGEMWHFLEGEGELWRKRDGKEETIALSKGMTITLRPWEPFQFRCTGSYALKFVVITAPDWPGPSEAIKVENHW